LAAAQGQEHAAENRDRAAEMMTPAQIVKAQELARDWKPKKNQVSLPPGSSQE